MVFRPSASLGIQARTKEDAMFLREWRTAAIAAAVFVAVVTAAVIARADASPWHLFLDTSAGRVMISDTFATKDECVGYMGTQETKDTISGVMSLYEQFHPGIKLLRVHCEVLGTPA